MNKFDKMNEDAAGPSFQLEERLLRSARYIVGMDEVGRGAIAGPVAVGVAVVDASCANNIPTGLADSKLLSAKRRQELITPIQNWVKDSAVGYAHAQEVDAVGINAALALAGRRALKQLLIAPELIILDGSFDWFSARAQQTELFAESIDTDTLALPATNNEVTEFVGEQFPPVVMQVKADRLCASVAAASVLAKVTRDKWMSEHDCGYQWERNAGYGTAAHTAIIRERGMSEQHRRSFCRKILSDG